MAKKLQEIFEHVIGLERAQRPGYLANACADDPALRAEVEALLRAHEGAAKFLASPTASSLADATPTADSSGAAPETLTAALREGPGTHIGPYKLLQLIGEGGFGSVFMAEQEKPVARKVALKIIKLGMDTRQVVARFEQERQALAMMDHPNIAKVLDAGATETGRPFFVMELVKGDPIVEYCDKNNLSIDDRLELFAQVCNAVQHAHTKGIIHRDIKPSNILVSTQDGRPHTKVIDFGIAKATASKLTEKTLFTEHRQLIGTPEYMSPEQAEGNLDIDTRTDVYSLGVLLYELLTGTTPFSGKELRSVAYAEIQRIIREVEPPKPSTRLSNNTDTIASVAARRHTEPNRLGTIVRGELDWIVMKALEKDRHRRYETANGLAMDIRRYLSGEAVVAAPPSTAYRVRKFMQRNRAIVTAGAAVAAALVIGAFAFAWQASVARAQRDRAVAAERTSTDRAAELEQIAAFQSDMLRGIDPAAAGVELTSDLRARLREALKAAGVPASEADDQVSAFDDGLARVNATDAASALIDTTILRPALSTLDSRFANRPELDARLRLALARLYTDLGRYAGAERLTDRVIETRTKALGPEHPWTLEAGIARAEVLNLFGRPADAEKFLRSAIDRLRRSPGEDDPITLSALNCLAHSLSLQDRFAEAEAMRRDVAERRSRVLGPLNPLTLSSRNSLSDLLRLQGKFGEAEKLQLQVLEDYRSTLGPDHIGTLDALNDLGAIQFSQRRFTEAQASLREAAEGRRRRLGENHPKTLDAFDNLAAVLINLGKIDESLTIGARVLEAKRATLGSNHPITLTSIANNAYSLITAGQFARAEVLVKELIERRERVSGLRSPDTLVAYNIAGYLYSQQDRIAEAEPYVRKAVDVSTAVFGEDHPERLTFLVNLGSTLASLGRNAQAIPYLREVRERGARVLTPDNDRMLNAAVSLSTALRDTGDSAAAEPILRETLEIRTRKLGIGDRNVILDAQRLATVLSDLARYQEAIDVLKAPIEEAAKLQPKDAMSVTPRLLMARGKARIGLAAARGDAATFAAAETDLLDAHTRLAAAGTASSTFMAGTAQAIADLYKAWDKAEPGKGFDTKAAEWRAKTEQGKAAEGGER